MQQTVLSRSFLKSNFRDTSWLQSPHIPNCLARANRPPRVSSGGRRHRIVCRKGKPFELLQDVFDEVAPLFPGEYIHIGGDECPKSSWKECPLCQKRIREEGLKADKNHSAEESCRAISFSAWRNTCPKSMVKDHRMG